jgi:hypothetical protein
MREEQCDNEEIPHRVARIYMIDFEKNHGELKETKTRSGFRACEWEVRFFFLDSYLVDPASSHMLVSKIKPCMSKYKYLIL